MYSTLLQNIAEYQSLSPTERIFVLARARGKSVTDSTKEAGIHRSTPASNWDMDRINAAILAVQGVLFENQTDAVAHLVPEAIAQLEKAVKAGDIAAIKEVFDRRWGKATQRNEHTGKNGEPLFQKVYEGIDPEAV